MLLLYKASFCTLTPSHRGLLNTLWSTQIRFFYCIEGSVESNFSDLLVNKNFMTFTLHQAKLTWMIFPKSPSLSKPEFKFHFPFQGVPSSAGE